MVRRLVFLVALLSLAGFALYRDVRLYFGRYDAATWQASYRPSAPPSAPAGPHRVSVEETRQIVPGDGLPQNIRLLRANSNLDVTSHLGRTYLAFRTAPDHFPSGESVVHIVCSDDERAWRAVGSFHTGMDLREPRLLSYRGRLHLYLTELAPRALTFEPRRVLRATLSDDGTTNLVDAGLAGHVVWRLRVHGDVAYMTSYTGGQHLYSPLGHSELSVHLMRSDDGIAWRPVAEQGVVYSGGGSEADFAIEPGGTFHALVRNERGDAHGFGSLLCTGSLPRLHHWDCEPDPRKLDSPAVFVVEGTTYAIGRRHVTDTGHFDVSHGPLEFRRLANQLEYITQPKRCSLWRFEPGAKPTLAFVLDLPSRGDTCYASVQPSARSDEFVVYDYSSPIDGPDMPWSVGQREPTRIYRHVVRFSAVAADDGSRD
jgi:hypothetical protein